MLAEFSVVNCTGEHVKTINFDVPDTLKGWCEIDIAHELSGQVLLCAGITNYRCEGCYDSAFRVKFVKWVNDTVIINYDGVDEEFEAADLLAVINLVANTDKLGDSGKNALKRLRRLLGI